MQSRVLEGKQAGVMFMWQVGVMMGCWVCSLPKFFLLCGALFGANLGR